MTNGAISAPQCIPIAISPAASRVKEAFAKAFGTGLRAPVLLTHINIMHDATGRPLLSLAPELQALSERRGIKAHHVTLTHERSMACAVVVLEA
jgi:holo-[acyl-carrier protein] synthase